MASIAKNHHGHMKSVAAPKTLDDNDLESGGYRLLRAALQRATLPGKPPGKFTYWGLPATGGYGGGCRSGTAAARIYLKFLRNHERRPGFGCLQDIVLDMIDAKPTRDRRHSFKGQIVGFFSELDRFLQAIADQVQDLDKVTFESLAKQIDKGLAITLADEVAEERGWRSAAAHQGWERRRAKQSLPAAVQS